MNHQEWRYDEAAAFAVYREFCADAECNAYFAPFQIEPDDTADSITAAIDVELGRVCDGAAERHIRTL
jgi:hypothetical protein